MTPPAAEEQDSALAAMISTLADGKPVTVLAVAALRLRLIDEAIGRGTSWATLGRLYGTSGRQLKRDVHKLRAQVRREQLTQAAGD